ncbi:MAG: hypothetical protein HFP81_01625 [Methylococcales symbiont of Hymedesmia sp. n. MRB-2018]|nr:MAG: hypothetical protein HFP78_03975 [Methylococcales symbiont of Hymedesmia sp. n. MRB-2018]KAF3984533.1 MAG: hypothetical protein HFP81_01625 [Methylococcales symbiont of Hymedesmia sp. n. MRB-2018]
MNSSNDFDLITIADSTAIYRDLAAGKIVPKQLYHNLKSELIDNVKYTLLFKHQSHFHQLYQHIGFELVLDESGEFFYIKDAQDFENNEADENAFKVQVILMLLGRYYARSGRDIENIGKIDLGINADDLKVLSQNSEYADILSTAKLSGGWDKALEFLSVRNFAHKTGSDRYFLNLAGMSFLYKLVDEYKNSMSEES